MAFLDFVEKNRTIRRFDTSKSITDADLTYCLECARKTASAGNLQRLRYITVSGSKAQKVFPMISLGGYLPPEKKPTADVAPSAYIVLTCSSKNPDANLLIDVGISAEAITLAASERSIGACIIRNFNKEYFSSLVAGEFSNPVLVIALGYPSEEAKTVEAHGNDSLKYYKDDAETNIVPKLTLSDLIIKKINKCK